MCLLGSSQYIEPCGTMHVGHVSWQITCFAQQQHCRHSQAIQIDFMISTFVRIIWTINCKMVHLPVLMSHLDPTVLIYCA